MWHASVLHNVVRNAWWVEWRQRCASLLGSALGDHRVAVFAGRRQTDNTCRADGVEIVEFRRFSTCVSLFAQVWLCVFCFCSRSCPDMVWIVVVGDSALWIEWNVSSCRLVIAQFIWPLTRINSEARKLMVNVFVSVDVERGIEQCEGLQLNVCSEFLFFINDSSGAALCDRDQNKKKKTTP